MFEPNNGKTSMVVARIEFDRANHDDGCVSCSGCRGDGGFWTALVSQFMGCELRGVPLPSLSCGFM